MRWLRFRYLLLLAFGVAVCMWVQWAFRPPRVRVTRVERTLLSADVTATGFVEATEVTISAKVTGRVESIRANEGDSVRRGDVLLVLERQELDTVLQAARAGLVAAQAQAQTASLESLAARSEAPAHISQAQGALAETEAHHLRLKRGSRLEEIQETRAAVRETEAAVKLARAQLAAAEVSLTQQENLSQAQVSAAEALLAGAKAADAQVRAGLRPQELAQLEAAVSESRAQRALAEKEYHRLASLYAASAVSKQQLDGAEAALEVCRQTESRAQQQLSLAQEGARREEREASRAQMEAAEARVWEARAAAELVRVRREEVEAARARMAQAEAALLAAQARLRLIQAGPRSEEIAAGGARVAQMRASVRQANTASLRAEAQEFAARAAKAQTAQARAQTRQMSLQLNETVIRSPIDGIVARRMVDIGELVVPSSPLLPGTELLKVVDPTKRWVMAEVDAEDLSKVKPGQDVTVTAEGYPGRVFPGRIIWLSPLAETKPGGRTRARIVRAKVKLLSLAPELKPGLEVDVQTRATLAGRTLVIPNDAVIETDGNEGAVFVVDTGRVTRRWITTGKRGDLTCEVVKGLREGELVVVSGKEMLRDGMRVRIEN